MNGSKETMLNNIRTLISRGFKFNYKQQIQMRISDTLGSSSEPERVSNIPQLNSVKSCVLNADSCLKPSKIWNVTFCLLL